MRVMPSCSTFWDLKDKSIPYEPLGLRWYRFGKRLAELVKGSPSYGHEQQFSSFIFYEKVPFTQAYAPAHSYHSIVAQIEMICVETNSLMHGVGISAVKKLATGSPKATKQQMIAACAKRYGAMIEDDNQVDAMFVLEEGLRIIGKEPEQFWRED
jgi:hypothetical protein